MEVGLTYDDVLLIPKFSAIIPSEISFRTKFSRNHTIDIPLVSAAMDTVTEEKMAIEIAKLGGVGVIHRNNTIQRQVEILKKVQAKVPDKITAAAIGFYGDAWERANALKNQGVNVLVLDTAHADSASVVEMVKKLKKDKSFKDVDLIVGNIATSEAAKRLCDLGVDGIKVGVGPGSICTTRIVAGVGVPQLSAVQSVAKVTDKFNIPVIADGGINYSGDLAKALVGGGWSVMIGSLFAGTDESPGKVEIVGGKKVKNYRGMGSLGVMARGTQSYSKDRYFQNEVTTIVPEGIEGTVEYKGKVEDVVNQLLGGLRQSMFYIGARRILDLKQNGEFIQITHGGFKESHPHGLNSIKDTSNYKTPPNF